MKRKRRIIQACIVLFIGINFLLVYLDKDDKVTRKSYINEWTASFQADMKEQLYTPGVMATTGEAHVYFDKSLGQFQEFLTKEGEEVETGDPLYSYKVDSFYESENKLSNNVEKLQGEVTAIESAIQKIEQYQIPETSMEESKSISITEEEINVKLPEDTTEAALVKEQYIADKEKELGQKQSELESAKSQLDALKTSGDTVVVDSPFKGRVKTLKTSLADPLITIEQKELQAAGTFSEKERTEVEEGLPVEVMMKDKKVLLKGELSEVSKSPETMNIEGESVYPFVVGFDDKTELEDLLPGYHADLAITLKESPDAIVLFDEVIFNGSVWKMTTEGTVVKQPIKTGIYVNKRYEITAGVVNGEWVAEGLKSQFRSKAAFITPIQFKYIPWKQLKKDKNKAKNIVTGILSR